MKRWVMYFMTLVLFCGFIASLAVVILFIDHGSEAFMLSLYCVSSSFSVCTIIFAVAFSRGRSSELYAERYLNGEDEGPRRQNSARDRR